MKVSDTLCIVLAGLIEAAIVRHVRRVKFLLEVLFVGICWMLPGGHK